MLLQTAPRHGGTGALRCQVRGAVSVLLACVLFARAAAGGPEGASAEERYRAWVTAARERGEAVDWTAIVATEGVQATRDQNAALALAKAASLARGSGWHLYRWEDCARWSAGERQEVAALVGKCSPYFDALEAAVRLPTVLPELAQPPCGVLADDGLARATWLLGLRSCLSAAESRAASHLLLTYLAKWHVRTWCEALSWDHALGGALAWLQGAVQSNAFAGQPADALAIARVLETVESEYIRSLPRRLISRRYEVIWAVERAVEGGDPSMSAPVLLESIRRRESAMDVAAAESVLRNREQIAEEGLQSLALFDRAIAASRDFTAMRGLRAETATPAASVRAADGSVGGFQVLLAVGSVLRVARAGILAAASSQGEASASKELQNVLALPDPATGTRLTSDSPLGATRISSPAVDLCPVDALRLRALFSWSVPNP